MKTEDFAAIVARRIIDARPANGKEARCVAKANAHLLFALQTDRKVGRQGAHAYLQRAEKWLDKVQN